MNIRFWKMCYLVVAAAALAMCLYYRDYANAMLITVVGFMVAQA